MYPDQRSEWFSGSLAVVVVQPPAETFPPMHFAFAARMLRLETDQCIVQTLVVALAMVMRHEFSSRFPHRALAKQDHPLQTRFLDRAYKPFRVRVQIGTARWKLHRGNTRFSQQAQELGRKQRITIMDEVALAIEQAVHRIREVAADLIHPQPPGT